MNNKKHLLILGCGYLGEAIANTFENANWQVTKTARTGKNLMHADITNPASLNTLKKHIRPPDYIIHSASSGRGGVEAYKQIFIQGVSSILSVFEHTPLLFTSSSSVYKQANGETVTEESEAKPDRQTGKILREAENKVLKANGVVMRLSGIYGENRSAILKKWLLHETTLEEDGRRILNQIHRKDAALAYLIAAEKKLSHTILNVSESQPKSQLETLQWLSNHYKRSIPKSTPIDHNRKRGWSHKKVSSLKLQNLGWRPKYPTFTEAVPDIEKSILETL